MVQLVRWKHVHLPEVAVEASKLLLPLLHTSRRACCNRCSSTRTCEQSGRFFKALHGHAALYPQAAAMDDAISKASYAQRRTHPMLHIHVQVPRR